MVNGKNNYLHMVGNYRHWNIELMLWNTSPDFIDNGDFYTEESHPHNKQPLFEGNSIV